MDLHTTGTLDARPYHHGDLRRVLLETAADEIARAGGAATLSLRALARAAGVSHAAPAHHFGDRRGLLTALAAQGHRLLAEQMRLAMDARGGEFLEAAVAYVRFAVTHPAHFAVMFQPDLLHRDDPELVAAQRESRSLLQAGSGRHARLAQGERAARDESSPGPGQPGDGVAPHVGPPAADAAAVAAWSLVHGLATLQLTGNLPPPADLRDLEALTRAAAAHLFSRR